MRPISERNYPDKLTPSRGSFRLSPVHIIPLSFLLAIAVGTLLLLLPAASAEGAETDFLTALFTSTTSVCVTGLVVVDTYAHWSLFGKVVILILIQLGGLGIVTAISMVMLFLRRRFSLRSRTLLLDALNLDSRLGLLSFLARIFKWTLIVEGLGAALYCFAFIPRFGPVKGIWVSVFTSISAFCNAGIDIIGPDSLHGYAGSPLVLIVTMGLIVLGGLGYIVWFDLGRCAKDAIHFRFSPRQALRRLGEHSRLVLRLTLWLILLGAVLIFLAEYRNPDTLGNMSPGGKVLNSLFQSVTFRTAGFYAVPQEKLGTFSCLVGYLWMFIGGSPIGTAGGVKTVTMFLVLANTISYTNARKATTLFRRRISDELMQKAAAIVMISFLTMFVSALLLLAFEPVSMTDGLFEAVSAVATVGLSRGLTPSLHTAGRLVIIATMYLGRIGPISMALFLARPKPGKNSVTYGEGKFYVG
ncbi:MAG: potassium transporter TrkH [Oscillospiraceae bacterium]|nr:potassium transporter TrkH [Oscillospiraceae bacterium]